jgi:hypothetical protein
MICSSVCPSSASWTSRIRDLNLPLRHAKFETSALERICSEERDADFACGCGLFGDVVRFWKEAFPD